MNRPPRLRPYLLPYVRGSVPSCGGKFRSDPVFRLITSSNLVGCSTGPAIPWDPRAVSDPGMVVEEFAGTLVER
jgi:hypothetical protein